MSQSDYWNGDLGIGRYLQDLLKDYGISLNYQ